MTHARIAVFACLFSVLGLGVYQNQAQAHPQDAQHDACNYEDGSGQRVCIWDAGHMGNGIGRSYIAINGGTDKARYIHIREHKAHRLTH